jgi:hypothetical protein
MLNPKNPPSLDNGCWNFSGKDARQRLFKKVANSVLAKTIHRTAKKPAMEDSDKFKYPGTIIGILHKMIKTTQLDYVQNSAINYLRIIADHGWFACCCRECTLIKIQRTYFSPWLASE